MLGEVRVASHYSLLSQVARLLGCTVQANAAVQAPVVNLKRTARLRRDTAGVESLMDGF